MDFLLATVTIWKVLVITYILCGLAFYIGIKRGEEKASKSTFLRPMTKDAKEHIESLIDKGKFNG